MQRRSFLAAATATAATACSGEVAAWPFGRKRPPEAVIAPWGFDLSGMDRSVRPGSDFDRFANGGWKARTQIPDDRATWGALQALDEQATADVQAILEELAARRPAPGSDERKIADYFTSFNDTAAIEARGLSPIRPALERIARAGDHADLIAIAMEPASPATLPIAWFVSVDRKNPNAYALNVTHAGLGLPNRTYYVGPEADGGLLSAYRAHVANMLSLADYPAAEAAAAQVVALETAVAERHWPAADRRDAERTYNPRSVAELEALAPAFPWRRALAAGELRGVETVVVNELDAMAPLAELLASAPIETLRAYLVYHALRGTASVLPRRFDEEHFAFFERRLNGRVSPRPRAKRAADSVSAALGEAIGRLYVERRFSAEAKRQMLILVENLRTAYGRRINALEWMSAPTKRAALEKLAAVRPKIGYPDRWRSYAGLDVVEGDAFGNALRAAAFAYRREAARLGQPTDRSEWLLTPQTVNAYYEPTFNEIVFPAAILQPPFFDPAADPAVNYGAIGAVIGHELSHGFDDQGARFDAKGVLRNWWSAEDARLFAQLGDQLAAQYGALEALPGVRLDGRLTLGETIADNAGLQIAFNAYKLATGGQKVPVRDGFSGDQRFFLGWAQVWRTLAREEALRRQARVGPHPPGHIRAQAPLRNMDTWHAAFGVVPGDSLFLAPDARVRIW